jgi:hypothetical protein
LTLRFESKRAWRIILERLKHPVKAWAASSPLPKKIANGKSARHDL